MRTSASAFAVLLLASLTIRADNPAPVWRAQALTEPRDTIKTPPVEDRYSDPFFSPPDGRPVFDSNHAGSGIAATDQICPPPHPFRPERIWIAADYFSSIGQGTIVPPLATLAPAGTLLGSAGALGDPRTQVLFGGRKLLNDFRPGLRATAGIWLTEDYRFGIDATFIYPGDTERVFTGGTPAGGPILAQPVFSTGFGTQLGIPVGITGAGGLSARIRSAAIGGDANFRYGLMTSEMGRFDLLVGYRYFNLKDSVAVDSFSAVNASTLFRSGSHDEFRTLNQFHGGQIGFGGTHRLFGRWTLTTKATVAAGVNISDVNISGQSFTAVGAGNGGVLTGPGNIGIVRDEYFAVMPEGTAKIGYDLTDRFRVNAGYSFLYWTKVRRAADQIDPTLGRNRPAFPNASADYWLQGWTVGVDLRY